MLQYRNILISNLMSDKDLFPSQYSEFSIAQEFAFGLKISVSIFSSSMLYKVYTRVDLHLQNNRKVKDIEDMFLYSNQCNYWSIYLHCLMINSRNTSQLFLNLGVICQTKHCKSHKVPIKTKVFTGGISQTQENSLATVNSCQIDSHTVHYSLLVFADKM